MRERLIELIGLEQFLLLVIYVGGITIFGVFISFWLAFGMAFLFLIFLQIAIVRRLGNIEDKLNQKPIKIKEWKLKT